MNLRIDYPTETLFFNDYLKVNIRQLMFDFHDHGPEKVWPRIFENLMDTQVGLMKINKGYKEQIITPEDALEIRDTFFKLWEANKDSLEKFENKKS